jgi:Flp pilus assembly protein TadB
MNGVAQLLLGIIIGLIVAIATVYLYLTFGDRRHAARQAQRLASAVEAEKRSGLAELAQTLNHPGERATYTDSRTDLY